MARAKRGRVFRAIRVAGVNEEAPQPPPPLSNAFDDAKNLRGN